MYKAIKIFSYLARQFLLPNPFDNLISDNNIATIVNWACGFIFIRLAYDLTGIWYHGNASEDGSIGFFFNYALLTFIFLGITKVISNLKVVLIIFSLIYLGLCIIARKLFGKAYVRF